MFLRLGRQNGLTMWKRKKNTIKLKKYLILFTFYFTVQKMNIIKDFSYMNDKNVENFFKVLRWINKNPNSSQRQLASDLGFSLGKLNYCLNELRLKGLVKMKNFKSNPNKIGYVYILTPKGINAKTKLTINFMKRKIKEYDDLKKDLS